MVIDGDGEDYSDIIETYRKRGLHITVLTLEENHGAGYARQYAMDYDAARPAKSEYFMFLDADDMYFPYAIQLLNKEIRHNESDIVIASFIRERNGEFIEFNSSTSAVTWMHGKIYRADYLRENNIRFLEELRYNEDSYFNVVAVNSTKKVARLPAAVYLWRDNPSSVTQTKEGGTYFSRANSNYIYGQAKGVKKIIEITGELPADTFAQTCLYIYYAMMQQEFEKVEDRSYMDELRSLSEIPQVQDFFNTGENWIKMVNSSKGGAVIDEENIIFYQVPFSDWAQEYLIKKKEETE